MCNRRLVFAAELSAQLADARGTTTAKLDAPVNKLARLLNSPSIKRVLLNDSLRIDFDGVIERAEVLVVKGALGAMGAGNTSVLMQLLVGMLDAALARRQDAVAESERVAVALKVDEAPLVLNRGFTQTMALKRSAGLETVACWQTDSQWTDPDVRAQLDALFAHRVYFATASAEDSRAAAKLLMASYSDTVRPEVRNLSALGRPDARLRLPRHWAIASWVTPAGRQPPFVAQTQPIALDREGLEHHRLKQEQRGARYRDDLSQPRWDRKRRAAETVTADSPTASASQTPASPSPPAQDGRTEGAASTVDESSRGASVATERGSTVPAAAYAELAALDSAHSVRWAKPVLAPKRLELEPLDLDVLELIASLRHLLSSQIHRHFNPARAATTTQRRLKRLSDAALVARFQFHRRDGGGIPMCYSITPAGRRLCVEHDRLVGFEGRSDRQTGGSSESERPLTRASRSSLLDDRALLRQARRDVRVAGWTLMLSRALAGPAALALIGPDGSSISPPSRRTATGDRPLELSDLCLPSGATPHDFLRTAADGSRAAVDRFQTVRPDVTVRAADGRELLVELDDRLPEGAGAAKLERYEHFLAGWSASVTRYARAPLPLVVFVCRDRSRARACARAADRVLVAARAYPGEYPAAWEYPSRSRIVFVAERDVYEESLEGWGVVALPPAVRGRAGGPADREPLIEARQLALPS